mgnify:FL=1
MLDDYEEGTWTIGISGSSGSAGAVAFTEDATYTKVGRMVTLRGSVAFTNLGSWAGRLNITGVPFTTASVRSSGSVAHAGLTRANAALTSSIGAVSYTQAHLQWSFNDGTASTQLQFADMAATTNFYFVLTYFV